MKRKVVFRADGNLSIGYGHFIRTLGIASIINGDFLCVYATQFPSDYQRREIHRVCSEFVSLSITDAHYDEFLDYLNGEEIVVLDNYYFTSDYQLKIRAKGCKVIYIDDLNEKYFVCDALINNIPGFSVDSFNKASYTELFLGIDYALLRKEFFDRSLRSVNKQPQKIFLAFGGSDIFNISNKVIRYFQDFNRAFELNLLIGDGFKHQDSLREYDGLKVFKNIGATEVAHLISTSCLCVVPASSLLNEVASIGSKILLGFFAVNQIRPYDFFIGNDLAIGVGDYRDLSYSNFEEKVALALDADYLIKSQEIHYRFQQEENIKNIFVKYSD